MLKGERAPCRRLLILKTLETFNLRNNFYLNPFEKPVQHAAPFRAPWAGLAGRTGTVFGTHLKPPD